MYIITCLNDSVYFIARGIRLSNSIKVATGFYKIFSFDVYIGVASSNEMPGKKLRKTVRCSDHIAARSVVPERSKGI